MTNLDPERPPLPPTCLFLSVYALPLIKRIFFPPLSHSSPFCFVSMSYSPHSPQHTSPCFLYTAFMCDEKKLAALSNPLVFSPNQLHGQSPGGTIPSPPQPDWSDG